MVETKQGNHCVIQYYIDLQALWQELDLFIAADCCLECTVKQRTSIEKDRMFDFLGRTQQGPGDFLGRTQQGPG